LRIGPRGRPEVAGPMTGFAPNAKSILDNDAGCAQCRCRSTWALDTGLDPGLSQ
jgi:hypothetical protein